MKAALIMNVTKQAASSHHRRMDALTMACSEGPASGRPARRFIGSACTRRCGQAPLAATMTPQPLGPKAQDCGPTGCHVGATTTISALASSDAHRFIRHFPCKRYMSGRRRRPTSRNDVTDVRGCEANEVVVGVWLDVKSLRALPQAGKIRRKTPGEPSAWIMA